MSRLPEDLRRALGSLPEVRASPGFTERVLARIEAGESRRGRRRAWAIAALLLTTVGAGISWEVSERRRQLQRRERAEALRRETLAIEREIEALRSLAVGTEPSIYLTGGEGYEVVMGLSPWLDPPPAGTSLASDRDR